MESPAGFDPLMMQYSMPLEDGLASNTMLPPHLTDDRSAYDAEFAGSNHSPMPVGHATLQHYSTSYDDAFSDVLSQYDTASLLEQTFVDSPSLQRDDKMLNFSIPTYNYTLLDYTYRRAQIALSAQLNGMFFMATGEDLGAPTELTCYRRNLFSITGSISIPRSLRFILTEQGEQIPIVGQELQLSATESVEGNSVKIISVPWKTPAGSAPTSDDRSEKEPTSMQLDLMAGSEMDPDFATIPIAWKRLQFRIATANNGRRKELQQHFLTKLKVVATLANGTKVPICEVASNPIIVRGRSPRNFQKKDTAAANGSTAARRPGQSNRRMTSDAVPRSDAAPGQMEHGQILSPGLYDWNKDGVQSTPGLPPDTFQMPAHGLYAQSSPDMNRTPTQPPPAPINLSLTDDEPRSMVKSETVSTKKTPRLSTSGYRPPALAQAYSSATGDHDESAGQLYEYFPLSLDDWQEPVDAVYRPHVVHHISVPTDSKVSKQNRSKRYFSGTND